MEIQKLDKAGIDFLFKEEGIRLKAYRDSKGIPTIGVGFTYYPDGRKVKMGDIINKEQVFELFSIIIKPYELTVYSTTRDDITQGQFNACVSLCYNIGVNRFKDSTVLERVNNNPYDPTIGKAFEMWRNSGKKKGVLLLRRKREYILYRS